MALTHCLDGLTHCLEGLASVSSHDIICVVWRNVSGRMFTIKTAASIFLATDRQCTLNLFTYQHKGNMHRLGFRVFFSFFYYFFIIFCKQSLVDFKRFFYLFTIVSFNGYVTLTTKCLGGPALCVGRKLSNRQPCNPWGG